MKTVLILCGGRSSEHEISLISAKGVLSAIDKTQYQPIMVGIGKDGTWYWENPESFFLGEARADKISLNTNVPKATLLPYRAIDGKGQLQVESEIYHFDLAFPLVHGQFGEDGTLQGMLDFIGLPFVGTHWVGSTLCMDKVWTKSICMQNDIPVVPSVWTRTVEDLEKLMPQIAKLGFPLFVKPSCQGSSVGVSKVTQKEELASAVRHALEHDEKCLIEKGVIGRELECAVFGRRSQPQVSELGEIFPNPKIGWYSYEAKYLLEDGARTETPAFVTATLKAKIQDIAMRAYSLLECDGMARVDFLVGPNDEVFLNELNTVPGFTPISMYPKMWEASGMPYTQLVSRLLDIAYVKQ